MIYFRFLFSHLVLRNFRIKGKARYLVFAFIFLVEVFLFNSFSYLLLYYKNIYCICRPSPFESVL